MPNRFTYSRWDGTQKGFDLDADGLFDRLADDLLANGNVAAALRRAMQQGLRDSDGNRMQGLREMLERLRQAREERLERGDLGGVFKEIADALDDVVDEERHAVQNALDDAQRSGDERRAENARRTAEDRNFRLDMLPDDLAGKVRELGSYDFESDDARRRFDELVERLRQQMMQQVVDQMSSAVQDMSPEQMQRTKEMLSALNEMIERRENGDDPGFEKFMEEYGDFFPENPQSLDELLQNMAARMAAAQAMLASMTPEQRAQLQALSDQLMQDMDLQWQVDQLGRSLRQMFPGEGWGQPQEFTGETPMGFGEAMQTMQELGELDRLENLMRGASSPGQLAEVDLDRARDLLGDDSANSLEALSQMARMLEEQGLIKSKDGRLELTPKGMRRIGSNSLRDLFSRLAKDKAGRHAVARLGQGHERTHETKPYEWGDPFELDLERTLRNAIRREGGGTPVRLSPDDFEIERTEHLTRSATVLMLDLSNSMYWQGRFLPAKKMAVALQSLISSQFPRDFLGIVGFSHIAYEIGAHELAEVQCDSQQGTNLHHGLMLARRMLAGQTGNKQIIVVTDGEPTAHVLDGGRYYFDWPMSRETGEMTLREVLRCTRDDIRINTFMIDADDHLRDFVERLTAMNGGRAFFTDSTSLGDYVLLDFIEHKKQMARRGRRAG
ncbi:MAG: VWA domain-containing protein [Ilumatobacteraceae bacterium]